jgi:putative aminopeptidase FrvX
MNLPSIDTEYLLDFLTGLLNTPSPTGFTHLAVDYVHKALTAFPEVALSATHKGALVGKWPGEEPDAPRALTAHVDTLGAMVKEIKSNGRLKVTKIGGLILPAVETEGVTVYTRRRGTLRGSLLIDHASGHVYGKSSIDRERNEENMEVRLDALTNTLDETRLLGVEAGDFVVFDPRVEQVNGFVRSRFLDDKACVACIVAAVKALHDAGLKPKKTTFLHISNYEEVGHGASAGIPPEVCELLAVDMAAVGEGQTSDEFHATLCVKDSGGPYHYGLNQRMRDLAETYQIPYKVDIYPNYGSDGEAFWRAGGDVALALIGPGVDASHNYERPHRRAHRNHPLGDGLSSLLNKMRCYAAHFIHGLRAGD